MFDQLARITNLQLVSNEERKLLAQMLSEVMKENEEIDQKNKKTITFHDKLEEYERYVSKKLYNAPPS